MSNTHADSELVPPTVTTRAGICTVTDERGQTYDFPEYQHRDLPFGRKIRLLKREPWTRSWPLSDQSAANEFSLVEHELESSRTPAVDVSNSPYVAMSYSWGEAIFDAPLIILVNGQKTILPVTKTAWEAVHRTSPALAVHNKLMWIDQICINQKDDAEKARQVALMGEIYLRCWHCMIWLGPAGTNTGAAFSVMKTLQERLRHDQPMPIDQQPVVDRSHAQIRAELASKIGRDILPPASDVGWLEMAKLLSERSWFSRLWTFQEATLCYTGDASVRCGPHYIPFITFIRAAIFMGHEHTFGGIDISNGRTKLMAISTFRYQVEHRHVTPLIVLLDNNLGRGCFDPRDRIYALLGLRNEDGPEYPIPVNYKISAEALYTDVARKIIKSQNSIRVCSQSAERVVSNGIAGLPSWVPDWTRDLMVSTFELLNPSQSFFRASARRNHHEVIESPDVLTTRGNIIDSIMAISQIEIPDRITLPERQSIVTQTVLPHLMGIMESRAPGMTFAQRAHHLVSTLTVGGYTRTINYGPSGLPDTAWTETTCAQMIARILATNPNHTPPPVLGIDPTLWTQALTREAVHCVNRKFALLKNGLLALVPHRSTVDNHIAILHGSSLPLVLRTVKDTDFFTLIGSSYVQGAMYGEKVTWSTGKKIQIC